MNKRLCLPGLLGVVVEIRDVPILLVNIKIQSYDSMPLSGHAVQLGLKDAVKNVSSFTVSSPGPPNKSLTIQGKKRLHRRAITGM